MTIRRPESRRTDAQLDRPLPLGVDDARTEALRLSPWRRAVRLVHSGAARFWGQLDPSGAASSRRSRHCWLIGRGGSRYSRTQHFRRTAW